MAPSYGKLWQTYEVVVRIPVLSLSGGSRETVLNFCQDLFGEKKTRVLRIQTNLEKFTPTFFMITVVA